MLVRKTLLTLAALSLVTLSALPAHAAGTTAKAAKSTTTTTTKTTATTAAKPAAAEKVDINTATREQLVALPGIGEAIADKVIANRPFANKHQLVDKGLVNAAQYKAMAPHIIASHASTKGAAGAKKASSKPTTKTTTKTTTK